MNLDLETGSLELSNPAVVLRPGMPLNELVDHSVVVEPQAIGEICRYSGLPILERDNTAKFEHLDILQGMTVMLTAILREDWLFSVAMKNADDFGDKLGLQIWDIEKKRHETHRKVLNDWLGSASDVEGMNSTWSFSWGSLSTHYDEVYWGAAIFLTYKEPIS